MLPVPRNMIHLRIMNQNNLLFLNLLPAIYSNRVSITQYQLKLVAAQHHCGKYLLDLLDQSSCQHHLHLFGSQDVFHHLFLALHHLIQHSPNLERQNRGKGDKLGNNKHQDLLNQNQKFFLSI